MCDSYFTINEKRFQLDEPYSAAWFSHLAVVNPIHAALSAHVLKNARRTDVCCICGDIDPRALTHDYQWNGQGMVLRLCNDCKALQEAAALGQTLVRVREGGS